MDAYCKTDLYDLKFFLLDHAMKHLDPLECLGLRSSSPYECFNAHAEQAYRSNLKCGTSAVKENFSSVNTNTHRRRQQLPKKCMYVRSGVLETLVRVFTTDPFLVRNDPKTTVHCIEKKLGKEVVSKSAGNVAANLSSLVETDTWKTFHSLSKDGTR